MLTGLTPDIMVADSDASKLEYVKAFSIPATTDWRKFLGEVDAVDVVTPADTHLEIVVECLGAKKDVFVEKPMAMTVAQARLMNSCQNGNVFQVGHIYRFHPAVRRIKSLLPELGTIWYAEARFLDSKEPRKDAGVTLTDAIHYFDLFNYLFDKLPLSVSAQVSNVLKKTPFDNISLVTLNYAGTLVNIHTSCVARIRSKEIEITGDNGSIYCDFLAGAVEITLNRITKKIPVVVAEPLGEELKAFMNSVETGMKPVVDGKAGLDAMKVVQACYKSSELGRMVEV